MFVGKNTDKNSISVSWPSNDAGNKAKGISGAFAIRINIANAPSGIWHDIFSVEIHWKLYPTKYESFCLDLSVLTTKYFRLPRDKTDLHWTASHNMLLKNSVAVPQNELGICVALVAKTNILTKMYEKKSKDMCKL